MSTKINRLFKPKIFLDKIQLRNTENSKKTDPVLDPTYKKSKIVGDISPFVIIEGYSFSFNSIVYMELYTHKFLPKIRITLLDSSGAFGEAYIPKQKPILSLYIRSRNDNLLPIRNDYIITSMRSVPAKTYDKSSSNISTQYIIEGELFIPIIKDSKIATYEGKSIDVLQSIAKELKLGFATNIESTDDSMIWINNDINIEHFIKSHITKHAYIDEKSFINSFVDIYYNLNYINLYPMLNEELEIEEMYNVFTQYADYLKSTDSDKQLEVKTDMVLSNWSRFKEISNYIVSFNPISKHGKILTSKGNIRKIQYYNPKYSETIKDNFLEFNPSTYSIVNVGNNNENLQNIANKTSYIYKGIDYNNTHPNYKFAEILNETGLAELDKINIEVILYGLNLSVIKNMQIGVVIVNESDDGEMKSIMYNTQKDSPYFDIYEKYGFIVDINYTGKYIIKDISYIYNPFDKQSNIFMTKLILSKSDWKPSPQLIDLDK